MFIEMYSLRQVWTWRAIVFFFEISIFTNESTVLVFISMQFDHRTLIERRTSGLSTSMSNRCPLQWHDWPLGGNRAWYLYFRRARVSYRVFCNAMRENGSVMQYSCNLYWTQARCAMSRCNKQKRKRKKNIFDVSLLSISMKRMKRIWSIVRIELLFIHEQYNNWKINFSSCHYTALSNGWEIVLISSQVSMPVSIRHLYSRQDSFFSLYQIEIVVQIPPLLLFHCYSRID